MPLSYFYMLNNYILTWKICHINICVPKLFHIFETPEGRHLIAILFPLPSCPLCSGCYHSIWCNYSHQHVNLCKCSYRYSCLFSSQFISWCWALLLISPRGAFVCLIVYKYFGLLILINIYHYKHMLCCHSWMGGPWVETLVEVQQEKQLPLQFIWLPHCTSLVVDI